MRSRASRSPCQNSTARTLPPTAAMRRAIDEYRVPAGRFSGSPGCHLAMDVLERAQGTNATGTPSSARSAVATAGHTEPAR